MDQPTNVDRNTDGIVESCHPINASPPVLLGSHSSASVPRAVTFDPGLVSPVHPHFPSITGPFSFLSVPESNSISCSNTDVAKVLTSPNNATNELRRELDIEEEQLLTKIHELRIKRKNLEEAKPDTGHCSAKCVEHNDFVDNFQIRSLHDNPLPRLEIEPFCGNPCDYVRFMTSFSTHVLSRISDDSIRLTYLLMYCKGVARDSISHCSILPPLEGFSTALGILKRRFGQPHLIINSVSRGLFDGPIIRLGDSNALHELVRVMTNCTITFTRLGRQADLDCTFNLVRLVKRLPRPYQVRWAEVADDLFNSGRQPSFNDLLAFLEKQVSICHSEFGMIVTNGEKFPSRPPDNRMRISSINTVNSTTVKFTCPACNLTHKVETCEKFQRMDVQSRWDTLRNNKRCFRCLQPNHRSRDCRSKIHCNINNCGRPHHYLLHSSAVSSEHRGSLNVSVAKSSTRVRLGFLPVRLQGPSGSVVTYAFLDNGADCSIIASDLAASLGLKRNQCEISITTLHGTKRQQVERANVTVASLIDDFHIPEIEAIIMGKLPVDVVDDLGDVIAKLPHLNGIDILHLNNKRVGMLIGSDVVEAHWVLDQRIGTSSQLFAHLTKFGWVLRGPSESIDRSTHRVNANISDSDSPTVLIAKLYDAEFSDIGNTEKVCPSYEDEQAVAIVRDSIRLEKGHYELAIPWREPRKDFPDNRAMAERRLWCLKKRLSSDQTLRQRYVSTIEGHLAKNHISSSTDERKRWFLPHHPVVNPRKPGKVRVVFDCAACFRDVSLNKAVLSGPDLNNTLTGVLLRFRMRPIALAADIQEMFLQVRLKPADRSAFSFLWWPSGDLNAVPKVYEWNVHPFGATSSPFCASYALRQTALDHETEFEPEVIKAVRNNFYVDDLLLSVDTIEEARYMARSLRDLLSKGGFNLIKWVSNSPSALDIPEDAKAPELARVEFTETSHSTLGLRWHVAKDAFSFQTEIKKANSKRTILSNIASVFDPLGILSPMLIPGKLILQDLCRANVGWDHPLPESFRVRWTQWCDDLQHMSTLEIARCVMTNEVEIVSRQLHVFSDASEVAYGACAYIRLELITGKVRCSLLMGRARVAPLKIVTIPRLELTAALLAARLMDHLVYECDQSFDDVILWTDSAIVLKYLENTTSRFATFVANRVRRIRELTQSCKWKYVPTAQNPADCASRGLSVRSNKTDLWFNGPEMLKQKGSLWRADSTIPIVAEDEMEFKRSVNICTATTTASWFSNLWDSCSSWIRMLRYVAWFKRFKHYICLKIGSRRDMSLNVGVLLSAELNESAFDIFRVVQQECFGIDSARNGFLQRLRPVKQNGLLYLYGRTVHSAENNPLIILPSKHRVTELIVQYYHELDGHSGPSHTLAYIRTKFWIISGMTSVRRYLRNCFTCRLHHAPICQQVMAPLPNFRIKCDGFPFVHCGVDYFGPFKVRIGRSLAKRFGCLFTCMQTRAVHIEVANDLSTDAFLMALTRFIGRRGTPKSIYSDNGGNFTAADTELKTMVGSFDHNKIAKGLVAHGIDWHFNPPMASHRGGAWERLIRSIRKVLAFIVTEQIVADDVITTALVEAERILNNRPIIPVYDDPSNPVALRPSDLLLLRSNDGLTNDDMPLRDRYTTRWKQAQHLSNVFWKRWKNEYLPLLRVTQKWLKPRRNLTEGDLVLIQNPNSARGSWLKGLVVKTILGLDGNVRQIDIKTNTGVIKRDIRSVCLLEGVADT